jgi:CheY-like chemotaxis protein
MKKHIVLIDDDNEDAYIFQHALNQIEPTAIFTHVGQSERALEIVAAITGAHQVIIFLDIYMPVINGWEILALLRSNPDLAAIPVFVYSTEIDHSEQEKAIALGATGILAKPYMLQDLKLKIARILCAY